MEWLKYTQVI